MVCIYFSRVVDFASESDLRRAVKKLDGVAFEVKQRRQSGSSMARDTFIELALIVDKAMVRSLCLLDFFSTNTTKLD